MKNLINFILYQAHRALHLHLFIILLTFFFLQNILLGSNFTFCADEFGEKIINKPEETTSENNLDTIIAIGLFLGTFIICWLYFTNVGGNFPPTTSFNPIITESLPIESSISSTSFTNLDESLTEKHIKLTGEHYSYIEEFYNKQNGLILTDEDWVRGNIYKNLYLHDQRLIDQTNYQADYIQELCEKYRDKQILLEGKRDTFIPFDSWLYNAMNKARK